MSKRRLDAELESRGLFTAKQAGAVIMAGKIKVNGLVITMAGFQVSADDIIETIADDCRYVSRGGLKLEYALKTFNIETQNRICLDVGVSTGGFSDCFLKHGATLVYGVDVGKGQLNEKVAANPKFKFFPNTNARRLTEDFFNPKPSLAAIDVSFISLKLVLEPVIKAMTEFYELAVLIKPQFELSKKEAPGGIVKSEELRQKAAQEIIRFSQEELKHLKIASLELTNSPIKGTGGNTEFLWHAKRRV